MKEKIYRSFGGGIARLMPNLELDYLNKIGNYNQKHVYHVEIINDLIWFTITNNEENSHEIKVVDSSGNEFSTYRVGIFPGDLAYWKGQS